LKELLSLPEIQKSIKENNLIIPIYSSVDLLKTETNNVSVGTVVEKGKKEGKGKMIYKNGNIYEGDFKGDLCMPVGVFMKEISRTIKKKVMENPCIPVRIFMKENGRMMFMKEEENLLLKMERCKKEYL
jgi:hypothetical protein